MSEKGSEPEDRYSDTKQFMTEQYKSLSDSFWRNEELGERRVNFLITLVTAVIAAAAALVKLERLELEAFLLPSILAVTALLLLGIVTWRRMLVRNRATDEYKRGMEIIRNWFESKDKSIKAHRPFPKQLLFRLGAEAFDKAPSKVSKTPDPFDGELRREFDVNGVRLGDKATIRTIETGKKWLVCGKGEFERWRFWRKLDRYLVRKVEGELAVYRAREPSWGGLVETVSVMNGVLFGILLVLSVLGCAHLVTSTINALFIGCALKLNAIVIGCALVAGLFGLVGAIIVQCLLMVKFYEGYNIRVPKGDSPSK